MAKHDNMNVKREVADFVVSLCKYLDSPETLQPYLDELMSTLYGYFACKNPLVRAHAVGAVSSVVITCHTSFMKLKDEMMAKFKKLLSSGHQSDRQAVIEALTRIGAGIGDQKKSIEADIEALYAQVVEDCKKDRLAHQDMLLKMTEFSVVALGGRKFSKYMPFVFPLVLEFAVLNVADERDDNDKKNPKAEDDEDDDEQMDDEDGQGTNQQLDAEESYSAYGQEANPKKVELKDSAQGTLAKIISVFERDMFLPIHEDIGNALVQTLTEIHDSASRHIEEAAGIYCEYIQALFIKEDPDWANADRIWISWNHIAIMYSNVNLSLDSSLLGLKAVVLNCLKKIMKHFIAISPADRPFLNEKCMATLVPLFEDMMSEWYEHEASEIPFDEMYDYGFEIVDFMDTICTNVKDNATFWTFADGFLTQILQQSKTFGIDEYRWIEVCLITTVFDHFGTDFSDEERLEYLRILSDCMTVKTRDMFQCLANHIGVLTKKYPHMLPPSDGDLNSLLRYLAGILDSDRQQRVLGPHAYDNALMAMSILLVYLAQNKSHLSTVISAYTDLLTASMPPTTNGDAIEGKASILNFITLLNTTIVMFEDDTDDELKKDVIRALTESLQIKDFNTPELHALVDPVLVKLQSEISSGH